MANIIPQICLVGLDPCIESISQDVGSDFQNFERKSALSVKEFCRAIGIGRTNFYALIKRKELNTIKLGGRRMVPFSELIRLMHLSEKPQLTSQKLFLR